MWMRASLMMILGAGGLVLLPGCNKDKDGAGTAEPVTTPGPLDTSEFTGKCKELLEHVAQASAPAGAAVVDQVRARVGAKVDAKRCQKGAMPEAEITCLIGAMNKAEVEACRAANKK
ncbi:MAG: hypothetical protein ABI193_01215 [Minicystis sp.]